MKQIKYPKADVEIAQSKKKGKNPLKLRREANICKDMEVIQVERRGCYTCFKQVCYLVMCLFIVTVHRALNLVAISSQPVKPWYRPASWFITALIFQSLMERYWPSLLAFQAMGEGLYLVGFWALSKPLFYACLPASCSYTFAKPTVFPLTVLIYLKT